MKWSRLMRRLDRHHAEVEAAKAETSVTFTCLADVTMQLLETIDRLKAVLRTKGESFDVDD